MRKFTLEQYKQMAVRFNKMSFSDKIITLQKNKDILTLGADYNWWAVKVKDNEIQDALFESESNFKIKSEWGCHEMFDLINLLGIEIIDA